MCSRYLSCSELIDHRSSSPSPIRKRQKASPRGEPVGQLFRRRHVAEIHFAGGLFLPHEMVLNNNVLGAAMLSGVLGESEFSLVISVDGGIGFPLIKALLYGLEKRPPYGLGGTSIHMAFEGASIHIKLSLRLTRSLKYSLLKLRI